MIYVKSTKTLKLSLEDCAKIEEIVRAKGFNIRDALVIQAAICGFTLNTQINRGWLLNGELVSNVEVPNKYKRSEIGQYVQSEMSTYINTKTDRQLNSVRSILKRLFTGQLKDDPAIRLSYQITDLTLLKYAIVETDEMDNTIYSAIDEVIKGFIWLYKHGGTSTALPDIIEKDSSAKYYYEAFSENWRYLQNYMRTHMYLMEK